MALFSQRKGYRPLEKALQRESVDLGLRNLLWSAFKVSVLDRWDGPPSIGYLPPGTACLNRLMCQFWLRYFKQPLDTCPSFDHCDAQGAYAILREYFFSCAWFEIYDFLEFSLKNIPSDWQQNLKDSLNTFLESETAAYRVVDCEIVEITDKQEIETVESAIGGEVAEIRAHLERALELLSDRTKPDYRNSIKESISAVEALCRRISGDISATLGDALKQIRSKVPLHPAFEKGLLNLYGYTSDSAGIRHSLTDESCSPTYADAKFMLVAASAFVNYLTAKASESNISLKKN